MAKRSSVLDGPRMGYGPVHQRRGGVPLSTVILAVVCVVLAGLLVLSIAGRQQLNAASSSTVTASPSPSGTDAPPSGAADAVTAFADAWSSPLAERDDALASVTVPGAIDAVTEATAAKLAKTRPIGEAAYTRVSNDSVHVAQPMADGSALQLQLNFDQAAIYGWLVSSVQLG